MNIIHFGNVTNIFTYLLQTNQLMSVVCVAGGRSFLLYEASMCHFGDFACSRAHDRFSRSTIFENTFLSHAENSIFSSSFDECADQTFAIIIRLNEEIFSNWIRFDLNVIGKSCCGVIECYPIRINITRNVFMSLVRPVHSYNRGNLIK